MLIIDWDIKNGWNTPLITPYDDFKLSPACVALHYGIQVSKSSNIFHLFTDLTHCYVVYTLCHTEAVYTLFDTAVYTLQCTYS